MDLIMDIKSAYIFLLLPHYFLAMEEKKEKPLLERATSGFLAKIGVKKLKESSKELATSSTSSGQEHQDKLRISNYLSDAGFDFELDYQSLINSILERDSGQFNSIVKKIENPETKAQLCNYYLQLYQETPVTPLPEQSPIDSARLAELECKRAAVQIWQEILETRSSQRRVPLLDLTVIPLFEDSSSSDSSSSQKPTVVHTAVPLKPCAQNTLKESGCINTGFRLRSSNMKKEKDKRTVSP